MSKHILCRAPQYNPFLKLPKGSVRNVLIFQHSSKYTSSNFHTLTSLTWISLLKLQGHNAWKKLNNWVEQSSFWSSINTTNCYLIPIPRADGYFKTFSVLLFAGSTNFSIYTLNVDYMVWFKCISVIEKASLCVDVNTMINSEN